MLHKDIESLIKLMKTSPDKKPFTSDWLAGYYKGQNDTYTIVISWLEHMLKRDEAREV